MKRPPLTAASPQQALAIRSLATYAVVDACRRIGRSISWHIGIRPNGGARTSMCPRLVLRVWGWRGRELILHGRFISTCRNSGRKHKGGHGDDVANDLHDNSFMFRQDLRLTGRAFWLSRALQATDLTITVFAHSFTETSWNKRMKENSVCQQFFCLRCQKCIRVEMAILLIIGMCTRHGVMRE
jgi:hypothetical protein